MKRHPIGKAVFADDNPLVGEAIVEVPVLLESWQLTALEAAASAHGLTAGTLVRCLLRDFLSYSEKDWPTESASAKTPRQEDGPDSLPFPSATRRE